jgi:DNA-directed RNA polymerase subunit RPC12/RpoP
MFERLKSKLTPEETKPFAYACRDCKATFRSRVSNPAEVVCVACGSHNVRGTTPDRASTVVPREF